MEIELLLLEFAFIGLGMFLYSSIQEVKRREEAENKRIEEMKKRLEKGQYYKIRVAKGEREGERIVIRTR